MLRLFLNSYLERYFTVILVGVCNEHNSINNFEPFTLKKALRDLHLFKYKYIIILK